MFDETLIMSQVFSSFRSVDPAIERFRLDSAIHSDLFNIVKQIFMNLFLFQRYFQRNYIHETQLVNMATIHICISNRPNNVNSSRTLCLMYDLQYVQYVL